MHEGYTPANEREPDDEDLAIMEQDSSLPWPYFRRLRILQLERTSLQRMLNASEAINQAQHAGLVYHDRKVRSLRKKVAELKTRLESSTAEFRESMADSLAERHRLRQLNNVLDQEAEAAREPHRLRRENEQLQHELKAERNKHRETRVQVDKLEADNERCLHLIEYYRRRVPDHTVLASPTPLPKAAS